MTPRERFTAALERRPIPGRVPHFELLFYLTMEALGKVHPTHRAYDQWDQMSQSEREHHRRDVARVLVDTAEKYDHGAILLLSTPGGLEEHFRVVDGIKAISGDKFLLLLGNDPTFAIPDGAGMEEMSLRMAEEPEAMDEEAARRVDASIELAEAHKKHGGVEGFVLWSDYCFNTGSFLPMPWYDRFVQPHLVRITRTLREMGFYTIKHTDGNIMPILDRLVESGPHALHSLDPQGGVDIAEVARLVGDKVCLIGNVDCGKLQTGTDEECVESARYALVEGMKAPGYIFSTSNCVYTGMPLSRYELVQGVWLREGVRA
jgi:uroporphyrinogen decarboxylase